jgi:integrase
MRIFKPKYKQDGQVRTAERFYLQFRDHNKQIRRFRGFTSRSDTEKLGGMIHKLIRFKVANQPLDAELVRFIEGTDSVLRNQFVRYGLLDAHRAADGKPLREHLDDFKRYLKSKGDTEIHAQITHQRAATILLDKCGFAYLIDIQPSSVVNAIAALTKELKEKVCVTGQGRKKYQIVKKQIPLSLQSQNFYLKACKSFLNWMVQDRRTAENCLQHVKGKNVRVDRRHDRRALSADEVRRLLDATMKAPYRFGMTGAERAWLYRLAAETGLRAGELKSLTVASFDLNDCTVTLQAAYSKHRREDVLPLRPDTAEALKSFLRGKLGNVQVFNCPDKTAKMLRADLAETEQKDSSGRVTVRAIPYVDESGRYADFHSLRHTFGTLLAVCGTDPKAAQSLMRHGDIRLTMERYTHRTVGQEATAIARLPDFGLQNEQVKLRATGTDDIQASGLNLPSKVPQITGNVDSSGQSLRDNLDTQGSSKVALDIQKPHFCCDKGEQGEMRLTRLERVTFGSVDQCSIQLSYRRAAR